MRWIPSLAVSLLACVHAVPPRANVVVTSAPKAAASAVPSASVTSAKEVEVRFEQRAIDGEHAAIWLTAVGLERSLITLPSNHACVVEIERRRRHDVPEDEPLSPRVLVCPEERIAFRAIERVLHLTNGTSIELPGRPRLVVGPVPRIGAPACVKGVVGPTIMVLPRVFFVEDTRTPSIELEIPWFGVHEGLGTGPFDFWSSRRRKAQKLYLQVESAEHHWSVAIERTDDRLSLTETSGGMMEKTVTRTLASYWLPCGAKLDLRKAAYRAPEWFPTGAECLDCGLAHRACVDPCLDDLTDEQGELDAAGVACEAKCNKLSEACEKKCLAKYKY